MKIEIEFIPHKEQRYETVGDWYWDSDNNLHIRVSDMGVDEYNNLVAIHEYIEALLCRKAGVKEEDVTAFDMQFEDERLRGLHSDEEEPGDSPDAPYRNQHQFATHIEKILAAKFGVDWTKYEEKIYSLGNT